MMTMLLMLFGVSVVATIIVAKLHIPRCPSCGARQRRIVGYGKHGQYSCPNHGIVLR